MNQTITIGCSEYPNTNFDIEYENNLSEHDTKALIELIYLAAKIRQKSDLITEKHCNAIINEAIQKIDSKNTLNDYLSSFNDLDKIGRFALLYKFRHIFDKFTIKNSLIKFIQ